MRRVARGRGVALTLLVLALVGLLAVAPAGAAPRCFAETTQCLDGRFLQFWEQNGGLPVFGLPLTGTRAVVSRDTGQATVDIAHAPLCDPST